MFSQVRIRIEGREDLPILEYSDTANMGGIQSCSITLPGRDHQLNGTRTPWHHLINLGDTIQTEGMIWDGQQGANLTLMDGLISAYSTSESVTLNGYEINTTILAESMAGVLAQDQIAYYTYYGGIEGFVKAQRDLNLTQSSGTIHQLLSNYLQKVVFKYGQWQRGPETLQNRLGYHMRSLPSLLPVQVTLAIQEGSPLSIMRGYIDEPLHEMFTVTQPKGHTPEGGGIYFTPTAPQGGLGGRTWLVVRPSPFPHAKPDGTGDTSEWKALKLHDFTELSERLYPIDGVQMTSSSDPVRNYFLIYPSWDALTEEAAYALGIAVVNQASMNRYALRPLVFRSRLTAPMEGVELTDVQEFARLLTWRVAGQYNRLDQTYNVSLQVPFNPEIQIGERARFRAPDGDRTVIMEGYIAGRTHKWSAGSGGSTQITLERCLPYQTFDDPAWFVEGLYPFQLDPKRAAPNARKSYHQKRPN